MTASNARRIRTWATALIAVIGAAAVQADADTFYVNGTCGDDAWTGTTPVCQAPDGPKASIQAGIDAAKPGDLVLIADGVYTGPDNKNLDFAGKAITVRGENGRDNCIIDCEDDGRGFYFHSGEGADSVVEGLTIRNGLILFGDPGAGAGVLCDGSSPTISRCALSENVAPGGSGVACCDGSAAIIRGCVFNNNVANEDGAAGVQSYMSSPHIQDCEFTNNRGFGAGGGVGAILISRGNATIVNCVFQGNFGGSMGAVSMDRSTGLIRGCDFVSNIGENGQAAISADDGLGATIVRCRFVGNTNTKHGQAVVRCVNRVSGMMLCVVPP